MKIEVLDKTGKKVEELDLAESVFGQKPNKDLLTQYLNIFSANQRQGTSATKTRSDVSGGGKKPWKQKGTGRARHGSSRSPIWVHGGVAHGPQPKDWRLAFPKKMKKQAMQSALSSKFSAGEVKILDELAIKKPSTKEVAGMLKKLQLSGRILIVLHNMDENVLKSSRNIGNLVTSQAQNLNPYEVIKARTVLFVKESVLQIQEKYK